MLFEVMCVCVCLYKCQTAALRFYIKHNILFEIFLFCLKINFQLHLGVESIRAPELMFQPSIIGSSEAGITETIDFILKQFSLDEQSLLVQNIFLTGGCANFKGKIVLIQLY